MCLEFCKKKGSVITRNYIVSSILQNALIKLLIKFGISHKVIILLLAICI
jgi:hypothetical protein